MTTLATTLAAVASGVAALIVGAGVAVRTKVPVLAVVVAACTVALATVALVAVAVPRGLDMFGIAHVLYLQVTVALPVVGVGLLVLPRWRSGSRVALIGAALLVVPAPVGIYATHVAPFQLRVDHESVPVDPVRGGSGTVRIAVLADLQTTGVGDHERRAVQAVLDAEPDVILIPGDLFQADAAALAARGPEVEQLLGRLDAPGGVYLVEGDVDSAAALAALVPPNVRYLDDEVVEVQVGGRRVRIGGTRIDFGSDTADDVRRRLMAQDDSLTVLVSHRPDTVLRLPPSAGIDLVVAGHTHGGQIALPFVGPPVTLSHVPRAVGAGGLHTVDGNRIYVSPGVGMERGQAPQLRFGIPPAVGIIELG